MKISSIEKGLLIIELLKDNSKGLSVSEISKQLGFPVSTVHHILSTFRSHQYVTQDPNTKIYSLGYKFLDISRKVLKNIDVRQIAHEDLLDLNIASGEATNLVVLNDYKVVYVDKIDKEGGLSIATHIGYTVEPYATAVGKVLLTKYSNEEIRKIFSGKTFKAYTDKTVSSVDQLIKEVDKARTNGYGFDDEEFHRGIRCISAPVRAGGQVIAAISVTGSIFHMPDNRLNRDLIGMVIKTADKISSKMHW
ncbi:MAG: IclR family transcriptional regulator [Deltaproteobacteria bacterium]|nr:IclR family transcriptional regulator [Deltaproteobacteria bacterium]